MNTILSSFNTSPRRWLWLSALIASSDQGTKALVEWYLEPFQPMYLLPLCNLTLVYNNGAAFSWLSNAGGWQRYFLISVTLMVIIFLIQWLQDLEAGHPILAIGLALIIGGAIGNLLDRVISGQVVDFISVHYANWFFPTFNLADSAISIGVGLLLIDTLFFGTKHHA